jgi:hypothetical protein
MRKSKLQSILTPEMLKYNYKKFGSLQKVADELELSVDSITKYMKLYNLEYSPHRTIYSCNHNIFSEETEKSFYLAGFIAADGSLQNKKHSKILKIALSRKDLGHLEKIKFLLESNNPIKNYITKPSRLVKTCNEYSELSIVSDKIYNDLGNFNIVPNKTFIYSMPNWLIAHPLVSHFMRGYNDGDGTFSHCGLGKRRTVIQLSFSIIGTENFINQYKAILINNCNINNTKIIKIGNVYRLCYSGNKNIYKIVNFLYKDTTIFLDRKYNLIKHFINQNIL